MSSSADEAILKCWSDDQKRVHLTLAVEFLLDIFIGIPLVLRLSPDGRELTLEADDMRLKFLLDGAPAVPVTKPETGEILGLKVGGLPQTKLTLWVIP